MLGFAESFLGWLGATALPAFFGLLLITSAGRRFEGRYVAAFALGIFLWFFVDTIGGSANLDVNAGFTGGVDQVAIVALFVVGVLFFFSINGNLFSPDSTIESMSLAIPALVAVAVGIHGFGEGTAFGFTAASTPSASLLDAFGGLTAGVAYALHKALEPMMIGACYAVYSNGRLRDTNRYLADILLLTVLFVVPSLIGATTGYFVAYDATYFFALGTGTSIYAALRLARPLFANMGSGTPWESAKIALLLVFGFLCIYLAALFHS
jgi:zinc transporter ZupT